MALSQDKHKLATDAVQAQERLHLYMKDNKVNYSDQAFDNSVAALENLKSLKSEIEGSHVKFEKVKVNKNVLQDQVRPLLLMNVPGTITVDVKASLLHYIELAFQGTLKKVIFIGLMTCPWYWSTNEDRGIQAKHNKVFVLYQYKQDQVFTPVNHHVNEQNQVIDEDWFYASEIEHFVHYIHKGSVRFIECLFLPESSSIYCTDEWLQLKANPDILKVLKLRGFLEQCRGQAVGSVAKKRKSGQMGLKDGASLYDFCESYRLLHHAHEALLKGTVNMNRIQQDVLTTDYAKEAHQKLMKIYQEECKSLHKEDLFQTLMNWKGEVDALMKSYTFTKPPVVADFLGKWLFNARCGNRVMKSLAVNDPYQSNLQSLLERIGDNVSTMAPEQIIMIAQAGSYLYGLATPESDVDFVVIYATPVQTVLGSCSRPVESFEKRGPKLDFEYGAYEARLFAEMLWKGSVVILELVFADDLEYTSESWKSLTLNKHKFLTERAIVQYFGLVKNNMVMIENEKYKDTPREKKLFYQIFHKLDSLEYFLKGEIPPVKCRGDAKDFIMRIRKGPLEDDISREKLYMLAKEKVRTLRACLSQREKRLPENVDYDYLKDWLMSIRGWKDC